LRVVWTICPNVISRTNNVTPGPMLPSSASYRCVPQNLRGEIDQSLNDIVLVTYSRTTPHGMSIDNVVRFIG